MKSAYELAMERLADSSPQVELSDDQRAELASIDEKFKAKIAEKEVFLGGLINKAKAQYNFEEIAELEQQRTREIARLKEQCDEEKQAVRDAAQE
jgi:hypothetical protein